MKTTVTLKLLSSLTLVSLLFPACAGTGTTSSNASLRKEELLSQAGFKIKTVTTDKQKQQLAALEPNKVSAVMYKGKLYYAYPDAAHNQVYVGRQPQYNTYKGLLHQRIAEAGPNSSIVEESAGPNRIVVNRFDGWGPLGGE